MEQAKDAGYVPIVFTQDSGRPFQLDRWRVRAWVHRGRVKFELLDCGPQLVRSEIDRKQEFGSI